MIPPANPVTIAVKNAPDDFDITFDTGILMSGLTAENVGGILELHKRLSAEAQNRINDLATAPATWTDLLGNEVVKATVISQITTKKNAYDTGIGLMEAALSG